MIGLIVRRLLQLPVILLVIYTITLVLAWAIPGNPLDTDGRQPKREIVEAMKRQYNLDSFPRFYASYLSNATGLQYLRDSADEGFKARREQLEELGQAPPSRNVFNLGPSLMYEDWTVNEIIATSLPVSVTLGAFAITIALVIGITAGVVGAVMPNSLPDALTLIVALIGISLPSFVTGTVLLLVLSLWVGIGTVGAWGGIQDMIVPALTLSLPYAAYIARLTRMGMIEHLQSDFVRTARAKGLSETKVVLKHALKNSFLPVLSYLGPATALAMTGSFVVERVFNVPGMGQHFVNAVQNKDMFLIMGVVLIFSTMLILFNLAVDVMYRWVDPRIE